jgi:hypothetical protein
LADKKISALTAYTTPTASNQFVAVTSATTKKITYANMVPASTAQWNADSIQGVTVGTLAPSAGQSIAYNGTLSQYRPISCPGGIVTSVFTRSGDVVATAGDYTTAQVTESGNLYFTNERVDDRVFALLTAGTAVQYSYNDTAGTLNIGLKESEISHANISGAGTNTHGQIDSHIANTSNPHTVTATQVGKATAQWNADLIQGVTVGTAAPTAGQILKYNGTLMKYTPAADVNTDAVTSVFSRTGAIVASSTDYSSFNPLIANNLSDLASTATARTNLGAANNYWNANLIQGVTVGTAAPTAGQILKYNGTLTKYTPAADVNTDAVTSVFSRTGAIVASSADYSSFYTQKNNNLSDLSSTATSRTNLGAANNYWNANLIQGVTVGTAAPTAGQILKYNGTLTKYTPVADAGGIASVVADTTPQLGGELDGNGNNIAMGNGQLYSSAYALATSGTVATDCNNGNVFTITLNATAVLGNPSNLKAGGIYWWEIKQDATGSRTMTFDTAFTSPGGTDPVLSTGANDIDVIQGISFDGSTIRLVANYNFS